MTPLARSSTLLLVGAAGLVACERYDAPPAPMIVGLDRGVLTDSRAPIVIDFGVPVNPSTLKLAIALRETDLEGNLLDEDADPATDLHAFLRHDSSSDTGATAELDANGTRIVLRPAAALPVGPQLVLVVEAGLATPAGRVNEQRVRVPFSYSVKCTGGGSRLQGGTYFMLLDVKEPVGVQIQILADIVIDPKTGALSGRFTNADRRADQTCPFTCIDGNVCRLLPKPACVAPSTLAASVDEYPDFIANATPPEGYSFLASGCAVDSGEATGVLTAPTNLVVQSPPVTVQGLVMTASFAPDASGVVRASGSLTADQILLGGTQPIGAGKGTMTARRIDR